MGAGASTLSPDTQAAITSLPESIAARVGSYAESIAERIAAPVFYPFRWEEAIEAVRTYEGSGGTQLTLPKMVELSAALLDLPNLSTVLVNGEGHNNSCEELLECHKAIFAQEGFSERMRELLRAEKRQRLSQLASLDVKEKRAMAEAVFGCCNDEHRPRVASTIGAILMGDVSSLVLDQALDINVPPALEQLGKLAELRVLDLTRNRLGAVPEYLGSVHSLQILMLYDCGLTELPASLGRLRGLRKLELGDNRLTRLPDSFAELHGLRDLGLFNNQLTILPRWVAHLPKLFVFYGDANPWQVPPWSVVKSVSSDSGKDLAPLRRYFEAVERHGATTSRRAKMVLVGTGKAGKSSTLRGMKYGEPRPFGDDERTVQLDIWTLALGEPPAPGAEEDTRIVLSAWDFAGQPEYAAGQQQYLIKGALYLLLVPAHRATDEEVDEVLFRWLDALQAKAPGAIVQVVLSHADTLPPIQALLAAGTDLEEYLNETPTALADAAAPQLTWLKAQLQAHAERTVALTTARGGGGGGGGGKPPDRLRVQPSIPCVCAAVGGDASLLALREHLHQLLSGTPPLLPSIGYQVPNSWLPALALPIALREGRSPNTVVAAASPSLAASPSTATAAAKRPYVLLHELQSIWRDEIAPRALPGEADPLSILNDSLELLCNQGELFIAAGMVFLDPGFATELLRPLVDHQLTGAAHVMADVHKYVSATPGLAIDPGLAERLLGQVDEFVGRGLLSHELIPFFWRATALARSDYEAAKRMLLDAGVFLELDEAAGKRLMMPMRMSAERPATVAAKWPLSTPQEGERQRHQLGVRFILGDARMPPGVIERCVGSASALKGYRLLECWRHGALLTDTSLGAQTESAMALLELTSLELKVEVRGDVQLDPQVLQQILAPLVAAVERVLREYPGFVCERKTMDS